MESIHICFMICFIILCFHSVALSQNQLETDSILLELLEDATKDIRGDPGLNNRHLPATSETMFRILSNSFYWDYATSQIPPGINVTSKQEMVNKSKSEVLYLNEHEVDYVWHIGTKHNEDESWGYK